MILKGLSLFSNIGIAETLLQEIGVEIMVANEIDPKRVKIYNHFFPKTNVVSGSILDKNAYETIKTLYKKKKCNFIIATPPCQGMSLAGKRKEGDVRNLLIEPVIKLIKELHPTYVLVENVPQFLSLNIKDKNIKDVFVSSFEEHYNINFHVLNSADYGVPQNRKRAFVLLSQKNQKKWSLPRKEQPITVRDAIGHLPSLESGETSDIRYHNAKNHCKRHIISLKHTPSGESALNNKIYFPLNKNGKKIKGFSTTYKRISWDSPSPTITMCNGAISSQNNVHPGLKKKDNTYSDARVLTLKEIFILSSLPENWNPPSWVSDNFLRQTIGEGIPPKVIQKLFEQIT